MKTCAIYARYSSDMQHRRSIDDQLTQCCELIHREGWKKADEHIYTDEAASGSDITRSGYQRLLEAARLGELDCIVVDDQSRFGRDLGESVRALEELSFNGVTVLSVSEGYLTGSEASGDYVLKAAVNHVFLTDLKKKVRRGLQGQVRRNFSAGGKLYGYRYTRLRDPEGRKDRRGEVICEGTTISMEDEEAGVVRKMFDWAADGLGLKGICARLNEAHIPSPRAGSARNQWGTWSVGTVRAMLHNEKYIGDWTYNKTEWIKRPGSSKRVRRNRPPSEWVPSDRPDLRIVDQATWDRVHERLRQKATATRRVARGRFAGGNAGNQGRRKYLLSGLLKCACGANYVASVSKNADVYVCNNYWSRGKTTCANNIRIRRPDFEQAIVSSVDRILSSVESVKRVHRGLCRLTASTAEAKGNSEQIEKLRRRIDRLVAAIEDGSASTSVAARLEELEGRLSRLMREQTPSPSGPVPRPSLAWVRRQLEQIPRLLNGFQSHIPEARSLLEQFFGEGLQVTGRKIGRKLAIEAKGKGNALNVLLSRGCPPSVVALRGIEPRFGG